MESVPRDRADPRSVDEATDAFDTVEWLVANVPSSGKVGILGVSIPGAPHRHGHAGAPPGGEGLLAPGHAGRQLPRRRPLPPGRLPALPDVRVHPRHGERAGVHRLRLRPAGPLRLVPGAGLAGQRRRTPLPGPLPDVERHRGPPHLRRLLEAPLPPLRPHPRSGPHAARGRRLRPGGPARPRRPLPAMERNDAEGWNFLVQGPWAHRTWRLARRRPAGADRVRERDGEVLPGGGAGPVLRLPPEGALRRAAPRGAGLPDRLERLAAPARVAAPGRPVTERVPRRRRASRVRTSGEGGPEVRPLMDLRPREPGAVPAPAGPRRQPRFHRAPATPGRSGW